MFHPFDKLWNFGQRTLERLSKKKSKCPMEQLEEKKIGNVCSFRFWTWSGKLSDLWRNIFARVIDNAFHVCRQTFSRKETFGTLFFIFQQFRFRTILDEHSASFLDIELKLLGIHSGKFQRAVIISLYVPKADI